MAEAATAKTTNFYPAEQIIQPHLRLAAENEPASHLSDRFKGQVAIEGLQAEYDAITELAELTDGQMRIELPLTFDDYDLYGPDGRSLTETAVKGLEAAREQAKKNGDLWFEVGRRSLELEEVIKAVDMIKSGEANTLQLTTDFPSALENAKEDVGGYNVTRRQALRRAITKNPDSGEILLVSQTLDGSNPEALDAVDAEFGFRTNPNEERLGQRQALTLSAEEQATIMDRSVAAYDGKMSDQFGGEWYAGRRPADYRNTYDFVCQQRDLIDTYKNLKLKDELTEDIMYDMAATINARFKAAKEGIISIVSRVDTINLDQLQQEMEQAGYEARVAGQRFSACGSTFGPGGLETSAQQAGYGNKADDECEFISKQCPECGEKNVKTKVTKTHISGSCGCTKKK
jgi:hypothetical protein